MQTQTDAALTNVEFFGHALLIFQVLSRVEAENCANVNIFAPLYIPRQWMLRSKFRKSFPGGEGKADERIPNKIVLDFEDVYHTSQAVNG